ncbi:MAG TPA: hypothetical protein VE444_09180, partial [Gaiellaceae bacterium]|nr:hypothetical protein [Gaiellaceae bacterium]
FEWDTATVKIDWALDGPVPWAARDARRSPVVHLADSLDELSVYAGELARGRVPERPLIVFGQYAAADPSRCPPGKEVAWAYSHVPRGAWVDDDRDEHVARVEQRIEELAPGFASLIRARHVLTPADLERRDPSLVSGAINGGTAQLHQQLIFRPVPGLGRPETPIRGLYLASASAHPGGGVHGAPGAIAARAVLSRERAKRTAVAVAAGGAALAAARSVRSGLQDRRR